MPRIAPQTFIQFRGLRSQTLIHAPLPAREGPSWGCQVLQSSELEALAPVVVRCTPSCPWLRRAGLQGLHTRSLPMASTSLATPETLSWTSNSPSGTHQAWSRPIECTTEAAHPGARRGRHGSPLLRFGPLQRFASRGQRLWWRAFHNPSACAFRFSQPPDALIRPATCQPCFMLVPLLGFSPSRALLPWRSREPSPVPLPS